MCRWFLRIHFPFCLRRWYCRCRRSRHKLLCRRMACTISSHSSCIQTAPPVYFLGFLFIKKPNWSSLELSPCRIRSGSSNGSKRFLLAKSMHFSPVALSMIPARIWHRSFFLRALQRNQGKTPSLFMKLFLSHYKSLHSGKSFVLTFALGQKAHSLDVRFCEQQNSIA